MQSKNDGKSGQNSDVFFPGAAVTQFLMTSSEGDPLR
jgi:hypothetical protein